MNHDARQDRTRRLAAAAARRASETEARAWRAVMRLRSEDEPVTFRAVSSVGEVSESYLYAHTQLSAEIRRLSSTGRRRSAVTTSEPSSADSLRTKLGIAVARVRELERRLAQVETENSLLRGEVVDLRRKSQRTAIRPD